MTNWFRKRNMHVDEGGARGYTSFSDTDLEHGFTTPEDAMLERIQRGESNTSETFDDLSRKLMCVVVVTVTVVVFVIIGITFFL